MSGWSYARLAVAAGFAAQRIVEPDEHASGEIFADAGGSEPPFSGPVLFLAGACNTWIGKTLQARHAEAYPNATVAVISDAGHDMFWDNPTETVATIRHFLGTDSTMTVTGVDTLEIESTDRCIARSLRSDQ